MNRNHRQRRRCCQLKQPSVRVETLRAGAHQAGKVSALSSFLSATAASATASAAASAIVSVTTSCTRAASCYFHFLNISPADS